MDITEQEIETKTENIIISWWLPKECLHLVYCMHFCPSFFKKEYSRNGTGQDKDKKLSKSYDRTSAQVTLDKLFVLLYKIMHGMEKMNRQGKGTWKTKLSINHIFFLHTVSSSKTEQTGWQKLKQHKKNWAGIKSTTRQNSGKQTQPKLLHTQTSNIALEIQNFQYSRVWESILVKVYYMLMMFLWFSLEP